jgi:uncharacterized integral membrane protein
MKLLSGLIGFIVAVLATCFALNNRQTAVVSLWPFDLEVQAPVYLLTLGMLFLGLGIGALVAWLNMIPHRRRAKKLQKEILVLNKQIVGLQQAMTPPRLHDENFMALPKIRWRFWERKQ